MKTKIIGIILGIIIAIAFSTPYIIFKEEIQNMEVMGYIGLIIVCIISNISILIPSSATIIVIVASSVLNPWLCILCGGIGTAIGEQSSYLCGKVGSFGLNKNFNEKSALLKFLNKRQCLTIFLFAFVPMPIFDFVGIASGVLGINWFKYTISAVLGKTLKFFCAVIGIYYIIPNILHIFPKEGAVIIGEILQQFEISY